MKFEKRHSFSSEDVLGPTFSHVYQDYQKDTEDKIAKLLSAKLRVLAEELPQEKDIYYYKSLFDITKQLFVNPAKGKLDGKKTQETNKILKELYSDYRREFSKLSQTFERWAAQRRMLIKKLVDTNESFKRIKSYCNESRFVLSSFSVVFSIGSILLSERNFSWSTNMFFASITGGGLSFICNLVGIYSFKLYTEDIVKSLREDIDSFELLERIIKGISIDDEISHLFPYRVNKEIATSIANCTSRLTNFTIGDVSYPNEKDSSIEEKIFFTVVLSNAWKDRSLLNDEEFIGTVRMFSKSSLAAIWWIWYNYKYSKHHPETKKLYTALKSHLKFDSLSLPFITLATVPLSSNNYLLPALSTAILNGLVTFETYCEIFIGYPSDEATAIRRLKRILRQEYKEMNELYDALNPYND